jgi:hypothetical protein
MSKVVLLSGGNGADFNGGELVCCNFRNGLYGASEEAGNFIY